MYSVDVAGVRCALGGFRGWYECHERREVTVAILAQGTHWAVARAQASIYVSAARPRLPARGGEATRRQDQEPYSRPLGQTCQQRAETEVEPDCSEVPLCGAALAILSLAGGCPAMKASLVSGGQGQENSYKQMRHKRKETWRRRERRMR